MKFTEKNINDMTTGELVQQRLRDNIGDDFIINDNLDFDLNFETEEPYGYREITKVVGHSSLFFCVEGTVELVSNSNHCTMRAGDVQYVQSGHLGEVRSFSPDTRFFLLISKESFFMPPLSATEMAALRSELVSHPIAHLTEKQMFACNLLYKMIRNALLRRDEVHYVRRIVQGLVQAIYFQVFAAYELQAAAKDRSSSIKSRQEDVFSRFISLVQKNYASQRNIGFYADKLCITPKYLSQLVYKASGIYAGDHIDQYVISEAKVLIKSRKYTIAQISDMLNFTSQAYFGRYFKKHTGMTPLEFADKG